MIIRGIPELAFREAIAQTSEVWYEDNLRVVESLWSIPRDPTREGSRTVLNRARVTVRDSAREGASRSPNGRRIASACWHAYRDVMANIFVMYPDADIVSQLGRYNGVNEFLRNYAATAYTQAYTQKGSEVIPRAMFTLCECAKRTDVPPEFLIRTPIFTPMGLER